VRRLVLVGIAALAFAPAANAGCGVTTTALTGKAPLTVSLTAQCASTTYSWDLGDGTTATGRTVQHTLCGRLVAADPHRRRARVPAARFPGDHVEVDKTRQVLFVVRGGKVTLVVPTSTGATGNTPAGEWRVYRKVAGHDWVLYYPSYFLRGFAVHGYPDVPPYPASHGCARIPLWIAQTVYGEMPDGSTVYVY
jgi:lipoprotein-anchoring transpeptidase ErfK/SrfK